MNKFKEFPGFCPHLNAEHSITVECVDMNSKTTTGWKPIRFECDHEHHCQNPNECPIAAKLPTVFPF